MKRALCLMMTLLLMLSSAVLLTPAFAAEENDPILILGGETRSHETDPTLVYWDLYMMGDPISYLQFNVDTNGATLL